MGIFGLFVIAILAILGNSSATGVSNIEQQFARLSCPMPSQTGLWNQSGVIQYSGATYNYPNVSNQTLTLTCTEVHTTDGIDYLNGSPAVAVGVFYYIGDYISEFFGNKVVALFTLISFILTPANFNFLGFTTDDLTGVPAMLVTSLYIYCYIAIGALLYKIITPFAG